MLKIKILANTENSHVMADNMLILILNFNVVY